MELAGKIVILTGASRGLGREIAVLLAKRQARLVLCARKLEDLIRLKKELVKRYGSKVVTVDADITDRHDVNRIYAQCSKNFGKVDILISNAGTNVKKPIQSLDETEWDKVMDTNVKALFLLTKENRNHMKMGKVVVISSVAGIFGAKNYSVYCASKHAVEGYAKVLSKEQKDIKVHVFRPYRLKTDFHKDYKIKSPERHMLDPKLYAEYIIAVLEEKKLLCARLFLRNWLFWIRKILF